MHATLYHIYLLFSNSKHQCHTLPTTSILYLFYSIYALTTDRHAVHISSPGIIMGRESSVKAKLLADNSSLHCSPMVITYSSPLSMVMDFHTSLVFIGATLQTNWVRVFRYHGTQHTDIKEMVTVRCVPPV